MQPPNPRLLSDMYALAIELALPLFIAVTVVSAAAAISLKLSTKAAVAAFVPFLFAFAFVGGVPGMIAGSSQEPIVGGVLTGLLGIISALLAYLFGKESLQEWRPIIPFAMMSMIVSAMIGLTVGSIYKAKMTDYEREYTEYKSELENLYFPVERERRLMALRQESASGGGAPGK